MKKKKKKKDNKLTVRELQQAILKLMRANPRKRYNPKQIARKLKSGNNKDSVLHALEQLVAAKKVESLGDFKFRFRRGAANQASRQECEGIVDMTRQGDAFVMTDSLETDVYVPARHLNTALHGDRVRIAWWKVPRRKNPEGEVLEVVERATDHFIGTLRMGPRIAVVVPDRMNMPVDIYVPLDKVGEAEDGDKVVVKVVRWKDRRYHAPMGEVTEVLGKPGTHDIEMKAILINNGFRLSFPPEVQQEANDLSAHIDLQEIHRRRDMRDVTTFTIDPDDAKDFDDALSIRRLPNGHLEIGIHIADVTHYVKEHSLLDQEAYKRSTSVYLVDRVLPMLPEKLSNELCSLRPHEDKLTFSAVFEFDRRDRIVNRWFGKTIIHSDRRFTYNEAQEILEKKEGEFAEELLELNRLAKKLRARRFRNGSINFETEEVRFRLDEHGVPIEVYVKERKDAHMLVEDFMLLANREVATYIHEKGKDSQEIPFVYRVHDEPDPVKVEEFARFARELGFEIDTSSPRAIAKSYNRLAEEAEQNEILRILEPIAIRTMAKAIYTTNNIGHYGLGFKYYTHFTSPIRRYADVLVHRILEENLGDKTLRVDKEKLEAKCRHISAMERRAMDAERESVKYKQVEYIESHIGEVFEGVVSGIIDTGFFVQLKENLCEGMVRFSSMDEPFEVEPGRLRAKGTRTGRLIKMGDVLRVKVVDADPARRQIEMVLAEEGEALSEASLFSEATRQLRQQRTARTASNGTARRSSARKEKSSSGSSSRKQTLAPDDGQASKTAKPKSRTRKSRSGSGKRTK